MTVFLFNEIIVPAKLSRAKEYLHAVKISYKEHFFWIFINNGLRVTRERIKIRAFHTNSLTFNAIQLKRHKTVF